MSTSSSCVPLDTSCSFADSSVWSDYFQEILDDATEKITPSLCSPSSSGATTSAPSAAVVTPDKISGITADGSTPNFRYHLHDTYLCVPLLCSPSSSSGATAVPSAPSAAVVTPDKVSGITADEYEYDYDDASFDLSCDYSKAEHGSITTRSTTPSPSFATTQLSSFFSHEELGPLPPLMDPDDDDTDTDDTDNTDSLFTKLLIRQGSIESVISIINTDDDNDDEHDLQEPQQHQHPNAKLSVRQAPSLFEPNSSGDAEADADLSRELVQWVQSSVDVLAYVMSPIVSGDIFGIAGEQQQEQREQEGNNEQDGGLREIAANNVIENEQVLVDSASAAYDDENAASSLSARQVVSPLSQEDDSVSSSITTSSDALSQVEAAHTTDACQIGSGRLGMAPNNNGLQHNLLATSSDSDTKVNNSNSQWMTNQTQILLMSSLFSPTQPIISPDDFQFVSVESNISSDDGEFSNDNIGLPIISPTSMSNKHDHDHVSLTEATPRRQNLSSAKNRHKIIGLVETTTTSCITEQFNSQSRKACDDENISKKKKLQRQRLIRAKSRRQSDASSVPSNSEEIEHDSKESNTLISTTSIKIGNGPLSSAAKKSDSSSVPSNSEGIEHDSKECNTSTSTTSMTNNGNGRLSSAAKKRERRMKHQQAKSRRNIDNNHQHVEGSAECNKRSENPSSTSEAECSHVETGPAEAELAEKDEPIVANDGDNPSFLQSIASDNAKCVNSTNPPDIICLESGLLPGETTTEHAKENNNPITRGANENMNSSKGKTTSTLRSTALKKMKRAKNRRTPVIASCTNNDKSCPMEKEPTQQNHERSVADTADSSSSSSISSAPNNLPSTPSEMSKQAKNRRRLQNHNHNADDGGGVSSSCKKSPPVANAIKNDSANHHHNSASSKSEKLKNARDRRRRHRLQIAHVSSPLDDGPSTMSSTTADLASIDSAPRQSHCDGVISRTLPKSDLPAAAASCSKDDDDVLSNTVEVVGHGNNATAATNSNNSSNRKKQKWAKLRKRRGH